MIKLSDLRRIKKLCFDKIAAESGGRKDLAVQFKPVDKERFVAIMSNGASYARLVGNFLEPTELEEFQISWDNFCKICNLFDKSVTATLDKTKTTVKFKEGKSKHSCMVMRTDINKMSNFKFDFEKAFKISHDNLFILSTDDKYNYSFKCFAMLGDELVSTDGNICGINKLDNNFGDELQLFGEKLPFGMWYFNPNEKIIVSEDKKIACTYKKSVASFPKFSIFDTMYKTPLTNWVKINSKQFIDALAKCKQIDDRAFLIFAENELTIKAKEKMGADDFEVTIPAEYDHKTTRKQIGFMQRYLIEFDRCKDADGNITICFDDAENVFMVRTENDKLKLFGMGLNK